MDLSVNRINKSKINNINFKGVTGEYNSNNVPVYRFVAPPHNPKEKVYLEIYSTNRIEKRNPKDPKKNYEIVAMLSDEPIEIKGPALEIIQSAVKMQSNDFVYRYKITDENNNNARYVTDDFETTVVNSEAYNVITQGNNIGITPKMGAMRHSFLDSDAVIEANGQLATFQQHKDFVRNHFNKLGGSTKGLNLLLTTTNELEPYRYIISTPDIGVDKVSSHKYWPNNLYQCNDLQAFKDFNFNLFERGKGYVADGAFTSQGLQSPMVQHVLKWGKNSPFYNMLKFNGDIQLGILPNDASSIGHVGVKLINGKNSKDYNENNPTYIQFFDDRLSSENQLNSNELIESYDKDPQDHYEIASHQDSIIPYYFEIDPESPKTKVFSEKNHLMLSNILKSDNNFLRFETFEITDKNAAGGATYWDGNVDIIKMNLSNPLNNEKNIEGYKAARNYMFGVATYWTEAIQSDLILRTAMTMPNKAKIKQIAQANEISDFEALQASINNKKTVFPVLKQNKTVDTYVQEFPLQSIDEFSPELSVIFAEPQFNKELLAEAQTTITNMVNQTINEAIPDKYKENEEYKTYVTKAYANTILREIYLNALKQYDKDSKLKNITLKAVIGKADSPDEERKKVVNAITSKLDTVNLDSRTKEMKDVLGKISLEDFKTAELIVEQGKGGLNWRFDAAKDIADLDAFRNKPGTPFEQLWYPSHNDEGTEKFWTTFIDNVKKYNPSAYTILELTDVNPLVNDIYGAEVDYDNIIIPWVNKLIEETGATTTSNYDKYFNELSAFLGVDPEHGNNKNGNAGNVKAIKNKCDSFLASAQPNLSMLSHMFVDNHDKPRVLHTLPLDMGTYLKVNLDGMNIDKTITGENCDLRNVSPKAYAVGEAMKKVIDNGEYSDEEKKKLTESLQNLVNGRKPDSKTGDMKRSHTFGVRPYEVTIKDLFKGAGIEDEDKMQKFHWNMMKNSSFMFERLWQVMNAIVGTPTLFNGTEFLQTGYETLNKNQFVANRNNVLHGLQEKEGYKQYFEKLQAISSLYKEHGLSALRNGFPISCDITTIEDDGIKTPISGDDKGSLDYCISKAKEYMNKKNMSADELVAKLEANRYGSDFIEKELGVDNNNDNHGKLQRNQAYFKEGLTADTGNIDIWPVLKYTDKSTTLSLITNIGVPRDASSNQFNNVGTIRKNVKEIKLSHEEGQIPDKTFKKMVYDRNSNKYMVENNASGQPVLYEIKDGKLQRQDGKDIILDDTVTTFFAV